MHARRADAEVAKELFVNLVANPPVQARSRVEVKLVSTEQHQTDTNGLVDTVAYEWAAPGASRKVLFILSTATSETAQLQVYGSASIIHE